jgi:arylsulfatase A-like enzyme
MLGLRWPIGANCLLAVAGIVLLVRTPGDHPDVAPDRGLPSILVVTIDTLRADHVGAYGYASARTPNMDALAETGVLFRQAVTQSPWTDPSHTSIMTGLLPTSHGVLVNAMSLGSQHETLVDHLRSTGYVTAGFVSGWPLVERDTGLGSRFHTYDDDLRDFTWFPSGAYRVTLFRYLRKVLERIDLEFNPPDRDAANVTDSAIAWLRRNAATPFFAWVHYYDPHLPYDPPQQFLSEEDRSYSGPALGGWYSLSASDKTAIVSDEENVAHMISMYDAEIAFVDLEIGRLLQAAREAAVAEDLLIVVTADHGESMGEHGGYFIRDVYEPTSLVPLIVAGIDSNGRSPSVIDSQVRLIDIAPTLLDLVGLEVPFAMEGTSFVDLMQGMKLASSEPALTMMFAQASDYRRQSHAVRHGAWKLIHREPGWAGPHWVPATEEVYDLAQDPGELRNVALESPEIREELGPLLRPLQNRHKIRLNLDAEQIEQLRSLGYLD